VGLSGPVIIVFFSFFIGIPNITYPKAAKPQSEKNRFSQKKNCFQYDVLYKF
jgi:hypothetical protein